MKKYLIAASLAVLVAGCAKKPETIEAAYVSPTIYDKWPCSQLTEEHMRLNHAYTQAAAQQNQARSNDIAGVILIGLPVSSLSGGNVASQVANLKGQQEAVRTTMIRKNCNVPVYEAPKKAK